MPILIHRIRPSTAVALSLLMLAASHHSVLSQTVPVTQPAETVVLNHVRIIDGTGHAPIRNGAIVIRGNSILAVGPSSITRRFKKSQIIDRTGATVMPGIINAHGHLSLIQNGKNTADAYTVDGVIAELRQYEGYGVTTMLSLGLNRDLLYGIRDQQQAGKLDGATVLTADRGMGTPGGAPPIPAQSDQVYRPSTGQEARTDIDQMAMRHANFVKLWLDSLNGTVPEMRPEIYTAAIDQAHKDHLPVAVHIFYLADAKRILAAGADVLAHSIRDQPVDAAVIATMKQRGTWYIPTFTVDESFYIYAENPPFMQTDFFKTAAGPDVLAQFSDPLYAGKILHDPRTKIHQHDFATAQANLKTLYGAGVHIGFGTDSGALPGRIPGFAEHRELELMTQAGLTPMQAIVCATRNNAQLLGIAKERGTLTPGKRADLLVLAANPLDNITNTRNILAIYHDGRLVKARVPASQQ